MARLSRLLLPLARPRFALLIGGSPACSDLG
jgi:hypothetical protein